MKNLLNLLIIILLFHDVSAQTNLIQDPGFENGWTYWTPEDDDDDFCCFLLAPMANRFWSYDGSSSSISLTPPLVYFGYQSPFEGSNYSGIIALHDVDGGTLDFHKAKVGYHCLSPLNDWTLC